MIEKQEMVLALKSLSQRIRMQKTPLHGITVPSDNVFAVLGVINKEVIYCRALLYLIRNDWNSFCEFLETKKVLPGFEPLVFSQEEYPCQAPCERYDKEGRIDIFLETKNHIIAIEAKVGAGDQEHQLARYQKFLKDKTDKDIHIIYLTSTGYEPSEETRICQRCEEGCSAENVVSISWNYDICNWMEIISNANESNCIATHFYEVLKMERDGNKVKENYINILKEDLLYPEIIDCLQKVLPSFWEQIRQTFFERLAEHLTCNYGFEILEEDGYFHKEEFWAKTLIKDGKQLFFCYQTNLFLRAGESGSDWKYIDACSFEKEGIASCSQTEKNAVNMEKFCFEKKGNNRAFVNWYYHRDEESGERILARIAKATNDFFNASNQK